MQEQINEDPGANEVNKSQRSIHTLWSFEESLRKKNGGSLRLTNQKWAWKRFLKIEMEESSKWVVTYWVMGMRGNEIRALFAASGCSLVEEDDDWNYRPPQNPMREIFTSRLIFITPEKNNNNENKNIRAGDTLAPLCLSSTTPLRGFFSPLYRNKFTCSPLFFLLKKCDRFNGAITYNCTISKTTVFEHVSNNLDR